MIYLLTTMKHILLLTSVLYLSGCTTATSYTEAEKAGNNGHSPKMLFGVLKVYPEGALKILTTPTQLAYQPSGYRSTYINTTSTIKHSNGTTTTITTKGYVR